MALFDRISAAVRAFSQVSPPVNGIQGRLTATQANTDPRTTGIIRSMEALFGRVSYDAGPAYTRYSSNPATGLNPAMINSALLSANNGYPQVWAEMVEQVLERDGHLSGIDSARRDEVAGKPFRVHPKPGADPDVAIPVAKFVRSVVDEIDGFESSVYDVLSANGMGYASQEIVWNEQAIRFPDQDGNAVSVPALCPKSLEWVHPKHFRFDLRTDEPYIVLGTANNTLPPNKFIFHASTGTGLIERRGFMRPCIWYHAAKQWALRDWLTFAHLYGIPQLEGVYDGDVEVQPDARSLYEAILRDFGEGIPAIHPRDFEVKITQPPQGGKSSDVHGALMGMCNAEMSKRVQGETLTTEMGQFGSYGASETHADIRHAIVVADGKKLCNTYRRDLFRPIVELNLYRLCAALGKSPDQILSAVPVASFRIDREVSPADRQSIYASAVNDLGLEIDEDQYRDEMGFDRPRPGSKPLKGKPVPISAGGATAGSVDASVGVSVPKPPAAPKESTETKPGNDSAPFPQSRMFDATGKWITIDGTHVKVGQGGDIVKGPSHLVGHDPSNLPSGNNKKQADDESNDNGEGESKTPKEPSGKYHEIKNPNEWGERNFGHWASGLSKSEHNALDSYTGEGYREINSALRSGKTPPKQVKALDQALAKSPGAPEDMVVHRGIGAGVDVSKLKPGATLTDNGYMSTSISQRGGAVQMHINVPKGSKGAYLTGDASSYGALEKEFLLPRGTKLKIDKVSKKKGAQHIYATVVQA